MSCHGKVGHVAVTSCSSSSMTRFNNTLAVLRVTTLAVLRVTTLIVIREHCRAVPPQSWVRDNYAVFEQ